MIIEITQFTEAELLASKIEPGKIEPGTLDTIAVTAIVSMLVHTVCACAKTGCFGGGNFSVIFSVHSRKMDYRCGRINFEEHKKALIAEALSSLMR